MQRNGRRCIKSREFRDFKTSCCFAEAIGRMNYDSAVHDSFVKHYFQFGGRGQIFIRLKYLIKIIVIFYNSEIIKLAFF